MSIRAVKQISQSVPTLEGAGVKLRRAFGFGNTDEFDPFLLFDDFRNENPNDYLAGFPWHPHRGIETITYVLAGDVAHGDSLGNRGTLDRFKREYIVPGGTGLGTGMPITQSAKAAAIANGTYHDHHGHHGAHHGARLPIADAGYVPELPHAGSSAQAARPVTGVTLEGLTAPSGTPGAATEEEHGEGPAH